MTKLNWQRANKLYGRRVLDHRYEFDPDYPDATARWLRKAENRQRERRGLTAPSTAVVNPRLPNYLVRVYRAR